MDGRRVDSSGGGVDRCRVVWSDGFGAGWVMDDLSWRSNDGPPLHRETLDVSRVSRSEDCRLLDHPFVVVENSGISQDSL